MSFTFDTKIELAKEKVKKACCKEAEAYAFRCLSKDFSESGGKIDRKYIENECCLRAFIKGSFLCAGTVAQPEKEYHLAFVVPNKALCGELADILSDALTEPKTSRKNGQYVLYYKGNEVIEDILTYMGAVNSSLHMMDVQIYKELRNNVNRQTNCMTANLDKTINASSGQIEAIRLIKRKRGLESLPPELQNIAELRLKNSDMTLRELGQALNPPLSRSGVNHRLKKLEELAAELK